MRRLFFLIGTLVLASSAYSAEQDFPNRPLRIVVPFGPGGGSDFVARLLGARTADVLGQNTVVDNRPGAASLLATQLVANAPNDGYTLLLQDLIPFVVNDKIYSNAGYDPVKSFSPIAQIATAPLMLVVNTGVEAKNVRELIALVKSRPGKFAIGNGGVGGVTHLAAVLFCSAAGLDMSIIPYKGTGPALTDVVGGRVHAIIATGAAVLPLVRGDKLRLLAVASEKRLQLLPEIPTMQESGVKGYAVTNTYILITAARTPMPLLVKLHDAFGKILRQPEIASHLASVIIEPTPSSSPQELGALIASEEGRWGQVTKAAGIRVE